MRICFVGWADSVHLERWAGYFACQGESVSVISFSGRGCYPAGVRQYPLQLKKRGMRWKELKMRYLLWRIKPDLVHVHWAGFAPRVARAWSGPLIVTAWGSDIYRVTEGLPHSPRWSKGVTDELIKALNAAHAVTCDSEDLMERIKQLLGSRCKSVHLVQWGVDNKSFFPADPDPNLLSQLGIIGRSVIFSPRGFLPIYNHETILSAFAIVLSELPDAILVMKDYAGNADYQCAIQARINDLGLAHAIRMVGMVPYERMSDLYRLAAVTVSVPFSDATSMSVLEAMACGSVPIVSDLPSLRKWIRDGWNGYLVSPSDTHRLAQRIIFILRNSEWGAECARRNLKIIEERASQTAHMAHMRGIYRDVLGVAGRQSERANGTGSYNQETAAD
jgi:glycosyltransferase involved in cell wall biosynthesis